MSDPVVESNVAKTDGVKTDGVKAQAGVQGSTQEAIAPTDPPPAVSPRAAAGNKVDLSIQIDAELLNQIGHLTSDPSKVIEVAVRQWLRGGASRDDDLTRSLQRNPPVPPRGEWND
nr:hypothetical protein [Thermoleptolyngbya sp. C42_A2020_037]